MTFVQTACFSIAALAVLAPSAHADYESEKNAKNMGVIERAIDKFKKNPALFDGTAVPPGSSPRAVSNYTNQCNGVIRQFNSYYPRISKKGQATARAKAIIVRVRELDGYCRTLTKAAGVYINAANARAKAAGQAKVARKKTCDGMRREALKALGGSQLHSVLDTWRGARTPTAAEHVVKFRADLEKLVPVCKKPAYQGVVESCKGHGIMQSSATNQRYDYSHICAAAVDPKKTLTDVAMRLLEHLAGRGARDLPTVDSFRRGDGWLQSQSAVLYKSHFTVNDDKKKAIMVHVEKAFDAAGVAPPADLSMLWANQQTYLDALKKVVNATAGEWSVKHGRCKGYTCSLAKKAIKKDHRRASIKKVWAKDWRISKNSLGIPLEKFKTMFILYKVPGEPYCQVRSLTAHEPYKGGGKYKRARGTSRGYVRFQKCR